ncbi:hypothetical protein [Shewanella sp.]|jgi:hypothetical protein|uniref:hypothetical protein n=1 Tax=Shewanella sp. TaxID=50422 RepID=UPI003564BAB1
MSHQTIADALAPTVEAYKEKVMQHTWGHLAPKKAKSYHGEIVFVLSEYGDYTPISTHFDGLDDSPWFFQDMLDFIADNAQEHGVIYRFSGEYRNHHFKGIVLKLLDVKG